MGCGSSMKAPDGTQQAEKTSDGSKPDAMASDGAKEAEKASAETAVDGSKEDVKVSDRNEVEKAMDGAKPEASPDAQPGQTRFEKPFVRIEKATGLRDADSMPGTGTSDAYVVVRVGVKGSSWAEKFDDTSERQWKSYTKDNLSDPTWDLAFSLDSVMEAALRSLSPEDDWELQARVYDSDLLGDDFLGEVIVVIPGEDKDFVLPLTGNNPKGNMSVQFAFSSTASWVTSELIDSAVVNGTVSGGAGGGALLSKMLSSVTVAWDRFMDRIARAFQPEDSSILPQNLGYIADMVKFGLLSSSYSEVFYSRSEDGGETVKDFPGPGSTTILAHAKVVEGLESICVKLEAGEVTRTGPDGFLGLLRLNGAFWSRGEAAVEPPCIALAASFKEHSWVRPIIDEYVAQSDGDGKQAAISQSAQEWIDSKYNAGQPFRVRQDVKEWSIKILHSMILGISLNDSELTEFVAFQTKVTILSSFVPDFATDAVAPLFGLEEILESRKKYMARYREVLKEKHADLNEVDVQYLASCVLDAFLFAGGASIGLSISCALAAVYGDSSPLARSEVPAAGAKEEQFAKQVTWESIRYFPPVVGFPWCTPGGPGTSNAAATQRTCLSLAAAMKDPRVWGEDAEQFKLRPLSEYHKLSVAFAEHAMASPGVSGGSRCCPAKSLALLCITEFLKAWFATEQKWNLTPEEQAKLAFTGSPTQKPGGFEFTAVA
mmetsp:Transcript_67411/g.119170  ORF Transcript_67411/g.119170 Transcript_67411/m.119170 type:complete len:715 (-) Transcript_67411:93-2237(-)